VDIWQDSLDGGSTHRKATTAQYKKCGHTYMPRAGFEFMIPVFEGLKTVPALSRAATGTGTEI